MSVVRGRSVQAHIAGRSCLAGKGYLGLLFVRYGIDDLAVCKRRQDTNINQSRRRTSISQGGEHPDTARGLTGNVAHLVILLDGETALIANHV